MVEIIIPIMGHTQFVMLPLRKRLTAAAAACAARCKNDFLSAVHLQTLFVGKTLKEGRKSSQIYQCLPEVAFNYFRKVHYKCGSVTRFN